MPQDSNKLSQLWKELKRRKVTRVITVYAAAAFVILELVDIIAPNLGLPAWTFNLVLILLCAGFLIAVILSWIYDVTPEGIQKTEPVKHLKSEPGPDTSLGWKISTYISSIIIFAFILIYIINNAARSSNIYRLEKSIAVLPFENWSYDEEFSHLGFAIANEIITELYLVTEFRVLSHTSTIQYADTKKTIPEIGEELGANYIIEGIVERQENRVNIHVQVIRAKNEDHIWADEFEGEWKDIFSIQDDIALTVADELMTVLSKDEKEKIAKTPTDNSEAYNLYLRGRYFWNQRTEYGLLKAKEYYEKAIEIDPRYALAYCGLADTYILLPYYTQILPFEANPRSKEFALKAVALDISLAESHTSVAQSKTQGDWDWSGAMDDFRKAIELNPSYSIAHHWYSNCLMYVGRFEESLREIEKALELDPLSLIINRDLGELYFYNRQYDKAKEQYQKTIDIDPDFSLMSLDLGRVYLMERMYEDALKEFQSDSLEIWTGIAYALMGRINEAQRILEDLTTNSKISSTSRYQLSLLCFALQQKDQGFAYLREAYENHNTWMMFLKIEPLFDSVRSDPRFAEFLLKTRLKE